MCEMRELYQASRRELWQTLLHIARNIKRSRQVACINIKYIMQSNLAPAFMGNQILLLEDHIQGK